MFESLEPDDDLGKDEGFSKAAEHIVSSARIPISYAGVTLLLTPANTAVRLFEDERSDYSRALLYLDDGSIAPLKFDDEDFLPSLVHSGFPVELPQSLDETDKEFMQGYMQIWTEKAAAELDDLL